MLAEDVASWEATAAAAQQRDPACWSWPVPADPHAPSSARIALFEGMGLHPRMDDWTALVELQDDRCGICRHAGQHVLDQDHSDGMVRTTGTCPMGAVGARRRVGQGPVPCDAPWKFLLRQPRTGRMPYRPGLLAWTWLFLFVLVVWPSWAALALIWYMVVGVIGLYVYAARGMVAGARALSRRNASPPAPEETG